MVFQIENLLRLATSCHPDYISMTGGVSDVLLKTGFDES